LRCVELQILRQVAKARVEGAKVEACIARSIYHGPVARGDIERNTFHKLLDMGLRRCCHCYFRISNRKGMRHRHSAGLMTTNGQVFRRRGQYLYAKPRRRRPPQTATTSTPAFLNLAFGSVCVRSLFYKCTPRLSRARNQYHMRSRSTPFCTVDAVPCWQCHRPIDIDLHGFDSATSWATLRLGRNLLKSVQHCPYHALLPASPACVSGVRPRRKRCISTRVQPAKNRV
jgi:hypothetical protein